MSNAFKQQSLMVFLAAVLFLPAIAFSQDYRLFNPESRKFFARLPEMDSTFGFRVVSASTSGNDSVYHFNLGVSDEFVDGGDCVFWAGTTCRPHNKPTPMGSKVSFANVSQWKFFTNSQQSIVFQFSKSEATPYVFYSDTTQYFTVYYLATALESVLGQIDSIKSFRVNHYDAMGNILNSPLNDFEIKIGKVFGLIQFFRIDRFPLVLEPVTLIGNMFPDAGLYRVTNEMIYNFEPGDKIQYFDMRFINQGYEWNYERYIMHHVLEKQSTPQQLSYTIAREIFYLGSGLREFDTIILNYTRNEVIAQIPFDEMGGAISLARIDFTKTDFSGTGLWKYNIANEYMEYCESGDCWGADFGSPPPDEVNAYVEGIGLFYYQWGSPFTSLAETYRTYVVYFKKSGLSWGTEVYVGQDEMALNQLQLKVFPNPTTTKLRFENSLSPGGRLLIYDINGKCIKSVYIEAETAEVDVHDLKPGLYHLQFVNQNRAQTCKFSKQ